MTIADELSRIDTLRKELHRHNHNYYVLNAPEISDFDFDAMMRELEGLNMPTRIRPRSASVPISVILLSKWLMSTRCCRLPIPIL